MTDTYKHQQFCVLPNAFCCIARALDCIVTALRCIMDYGTLIMCSTVSHARRWLDANCTNAAAAVSGKQ